MEHIKVVTDLTIVHWLLAYGGLAVHLLLKIAEVDGEKLRAIKRRELITTVASVIAIPIILIICTEPSMENILPINYATSALAGYQTQSVIRSISKISQRTKD